MVKSYISAIKRLLINDDYDWQDNQVLLASLTRACRLINDHVRARLPIHCGLLELILFEVDRFYSQAGQMFLQKLYKALFAISYYGLLHVGEVTMSPHVIKVKNVHMGTNKDKILLILYSSKTHSTANRPQKKKILSNKTEKTGRHFYRNFCPLTLMREYLSIRGGYRTDAEQFLVFADHAPVSAEQARRVLKEMISILRLNPNIYDFHSLRIGRASDLVKYGCSVAEVQRMGRWKSNVVYKYIRE